MTTLNVELSYTRPSVLRVLSRAMAEIADLNEAELSIGSPVLGNVRMSDEDYSEQKAEAIAATEGALPVNIGRPATAEEAATVTESAVAESPKRERGKPAPGKARRTKEEIAEDEAADAAEAASAPARVADDERQSKIMAAGRAAVDADASAAGKHASDCATHNMPAKPNGPCDCGAEPKPAISTGEERIDPTTAEDAAQDAEDEAAEAAAHATTTLTHDDVRAALKKYVDAYGMPAAMEDGPKVFKMLFGDNAVKVSDVPTDQASLQKAIDGIGEMLAKNPFKREANL